MEVLKGDVLSINNEYRSYQDYKAAVDAELQKTAEGFVKIGFLLKVARDTDILKESGYATVNEFAQAEYNLDKSQVSRFIRINDEYSEGGYSDRLQEKYQGYGYAKLAIMLLLPAVINEELSANYSKTEIQMIKEEVEEERKTSDIEVMLEEKDNRQAEYGVFGKVLHQLCHDKPDLYLKLYEAVNNTVYEGTNRAVINKLVEALAPAGEAIHIVRIPGEGRKMLSIKGVEVNPTVIDVRSNQKENCSWDTLINEMEVLSGAPEDTDAKENWKRLYGEKFPVKEEPKKTDAGTVQKKEDKKKPSKVSKAKVKENNENKSIRDVKREEPESGEKRSSDNESNGSRSANEPPASGQSGHDNVPIGNTEEHGSGTNAEEEQLPGQMQIEKDFPQYCPEEEKDKVAPVQPEMPSDTVNTNADEVSRNIRFMSGQVAEAVEKRRYGIAKKFLKRMLELLEKLDDEEADNE